MYRNWVWVFTIVFTYWACLCGEACLADQPKQPLRVGVILPLSGDVASAGEAIRNGMTIAYRKLPEKTRGQLELYYEDDAFRPQRTISAFNKLIGSNRVQVIVSAGSSTSKALAPIADQKKIPVIAIATDPKVVEGKSYVVNFWVTPEEQIRTAIPEAHRRNYRKIARITSIHDFSLAMKERFDQVNAGKIEVVIDEEFPPSVKDFRSYLAKVKTHQDVDAILTALLPGQIGVFAKQARQMGITLPIFGFETLEDANEVKVSEGALVGQWYVNTDDPNDLFINEYKKEFPEASLYGASNGHDIILLLGAAVERRLNPEQINHFLHTVKNFTGVLGTYSASGDNRFTLPAAVKVVTEDGFKKLHTPRS